VQTIKQTREKLQWNLQLPKLFLVTHFSIETPNRTR
jgi:hypothetical protein